MRRDIKNYLNNGILLNKNQYNYSFFGYDRSIHHYNNILVSNNEKTCTRVYIQQIYTYIKKILLLIE